MRTITPRLADYPIRTLEKLRFADTDRNGHITNTVFAVCCQNARMELLCDPRRVPISSNTQFVTAKLLLEFRAEMHWPGSVEIGTRIERIGRSSIRLAKALFLAGHCVATSESVVVPMDAETRRSACLPRQTVAALQAIKATRPSLWAVYRDRRFWRIAPRSALGIGTSWSLPSLWAAPWLREVGGLDRASVVQHLSVMAVSVCASALLLGLVADRVRRRDLKTELVLASTLGASMTAQAALVFGWLISSFLLWSVIAAASAATVLSFAILSEYFPKEISGRANAALNLLHVGAAFVLQSAAGLIIEQWPEARGTCPAEAHQLAMSAAVVMQLAAFAWLALPPRRVPVPGMARAANRSLSAARKWPATATTRYAMAALAWTQHVELVSKQAVGWRAAAAASAVFCFGLAAAPAMTTSRAAIAVQILEVDRLADIPASDGRASAAATIDGRAALLAGLAKSPLWRAPDLMRSVSMRPEPILRPSPAPLASNVRAQQ